MTEGIGLREQKKIDTRRRLQEVALELFAARGFDHVTVTDVARAAHVSPATVFNYFPTKEDLVLQGMAEYGERLVGALRDRAPGTSVLEAFRAHLREPRGVLAVDDPRAVEGLVRVRAIIAASPALRARELLLADAAAADLAALLAEEQGDGIRTRALATAAIGITQAMTLEVHRLAESGLLGTEIAATVLPEGTAAVDVLIRGLARTSAAPGGTAPT
ncbi:TetR/AcrR family transcriptional regulator [Tsukamurella paurometabola]|uniref:HTH-type transcriptional regulator luxR n=1 Tax=Tsukamurella paurometabola TaxID=2061 RepID=A0A3P8KEG7_TSUPA|nr:TetR family transcriptional regulator [Tsukamurella paurometabola]MBS4099860.1 TetR family transcriptional regulator [Tsukamurella paurometabola]VDR38188.1 HTH-type transcriptional regulator luxR [Tsukamurella paurometabola]